MRRIVACLFAALALPTAMLRAGAETTLIPVWHEGLLYNSVAFGASLNGNNQDPAKCRTNANHHTHVAFPGEANEVKGWCDDPTFRTFVGSVPTQTEDGKTVTGSTLHISLHFVSGDEPPTDLLPPDESVRRSADAHVTVTVDGLVVGNTYSLTSENRLFISPHVLAVPIAPGKQFTIFIDPRFGIHVEWHIDADLELKTA